MSRWSLTPQLPGESAEQALARLIQDMELILAEQEQIELELRGTAGRTTSRAGPLNMQGQRITNLPDRPQSDADACSLHFHKSGDFLYAENGAPFRTDRTIEHAAATTPQGSVTLGQLEALLAQFALRQEPAGTIKLWYGTLAAIPPGWQLCNGTNGTPDLRDKFVPGAGGAYASGATGGADTLNLAHTHTPGTLAVSAHAGTAVTDHAAFTHTSNGAHTHNSHTTDVETLVAGAVTQLSGPITHSSDGGHTHDAHPLAAHTVTQPAPHTLSGATDSALSAATENRPQFRAIYYIMKL